MAYLTKLRTLKNKRVSLPNVLLISVFVALVSFVAGNRADSIVAQFGGSSNPSTVDFSSLDGVYDVLKRKYDGKLDSQALVDGAKAGMVEATGDPYTTFLTDKQAAEFENDLSGSFEGIGAELARRNDRLVIVSTLDDSPAKSSGLMGGDAIVRVNNEDSVDWTVEKAVSKIRGEAGTSVKLTVLRGSELKEFSITRAAITDPSVKSEVTPEGVGIMRISRFGEDTVGLSRKVAEDFKARGVKSVILDLRGNGGGYINTAQAVAGLWLEDQVVVTERGTIGSQSLRAGNDAPLKGIKTIVLVNGGSASASEIVAGALSDYGVATLVGEKTFGKGSAQVIEDAPGGGKLKVTVAKWYTPKGKNIQKDGLKPGVEVKLTVDDVNTGRDPQKDKALELAR